MRLKEKHPSYVACKGEEAVIAFLDKVLGDWYAFEVEITPDVEDEYLFRVEVLYPKDSLPYGEKATSKVYFNSYPIGGTQFYLDADSPVSTEEIDAEKQFLVHLLMA